MRPLNGGGRSFQQCVAANLKLPLKAVVLCGGALSGSTLERRPQVYCDFRQGSPPRLVALDSSAPGFAAALRRVDACGARARVTVHVFCARAGQLHAKDIVNNARSLSTVPPAFVRMLRGLGTPVLVRGHPGWAGHVDTSYDARPHAPPTNREPAPAIYDAREQVLYWSDSTNEIAFVVPSGRDTTDTEDRNDSIKSDVDGSCLSNRSSDKGAGSCWDVSGSSTATGTYERSVSESERTADRGGKLADKLRALSLDLDKQPQAQLTGSGRRNRDYTTKILIIWLEDFEDHLNLPIDDLLTYCETGLPWRRHEVVTLCVSARRCGLVRLQCAAAGLLPDAALVAPALLSDCLRRAALDAARRTRLNTDLYQPPHVRRRHLIQELAQQYKKDLTEPELLESLFRPPE